MTEKYTVKELQSKEIIFNHIHLGTNLPVLESFRKYIYREIDRMGCFSLILLEQDSEDIVGHVMLYKWENTLYFGFFFVKNEDYERVSFLLDEIKKYASNLRCKKIFGPANLPPYIFGFGFSDIITDDSIFAMAPTTNPIYIEHFKACGFEIGQGLSHYKIPMGPIPYEKKWDIRSADFTKKNEWKEPFLDLQYRLYPVTIQITPNRGDSFDDVIEFIEEFAYNSMILFTYVNEKIIGLGWGSANPYDLGDDGKSKSFVLFGGAVEPEYQKQGIVSATLYHWIDLHANLGVTHGESCISDNNLAAKKLMEHWLGKPTRHHVMMQFDLNEE